MASTSSLATKLRERYPELSFSASDTARWSADEQTVYFIKSLRNDDVYDLLHETGHALQNHQGYEKDVELLTYEREAWDAARQIAPELDYQIPDEYVQASLDSYRDWLHARSQCPTCAQTGLQDGDSYHCLVCKSRWRPNEAKHYGLRRYGIKKTPK